MFLLLLACAAGERNWLVSDPFDTVVATFGNGDVKVRATERDDAEVRWSGAAVGAVPEARVADGVLYVGAECRACGGELLIDVPAGVCVDAELDAGSLTLDLDAPADVVVRMRHGDVDIEVPEGEYAVDVVALAASVRLDGVTDREDAEHAISVVLDAGELRVTGR